MLDCMDQVPGPVRWHIYGKKAHQIRAMVRVNSYMGRKLMNELHCRVTLSFEDIKNTLGLAYSKKFKLTSGKLFRTQEQHH